MQCSKYKWGQRTLIHEYELHNSALSCCYGFRLDSMVPACVPFPSIISTIGLCLTWFLPLSLSLSLSLSFALSLSHTSFSLMVPRDTSRHGNHMTAVGGEVMSGKPFNKWFFRGQHNQTFWYCCWHSQWTNQYVHHTHHVSIANSIFYSVSCGGTSGSLVL